MIHICFSLHDKIGRYSKFTGTAMTSVFENTTSDVTVHILHDNTLTQDNREKFIYLSGRYGQTVKFYNVKELCKEKLQEYVDLFPAIKDSRVTVAGLYRLLIPQLFSSEMHKVIYLDSDIIVNLDIKELWRIELADKAVAAAPESEIMLYNPDIADRYLVKNDYVAWGDYFNSGVLVMNLKKMRQSEKSIIDGIKFRGENPLCDYFDQDILNYVFSKDYVKLEEKFDTFISKARKFKKVYNSIYHYIGATLEANIKDPFNQLWFHYFTKTPWFNSETIVRLCDAFLDSRNDFKDSAANILEIMSGKTRAFFVEPSKVDSIKKFFSINDDEQIIIAKNRDSVQELIDAMKDSEGKTVFFIMTKNFMKKNFLLNLLTKIGFVPGKDFVNGREYLSTLQGVPFDSYPLIQAM